MQQVVILPEQAFPAKLMLNPELTMDDDAYFDFCAANPNVRFERNEQGEIIIVPPAGFESDRRNAQLVRQLGDWAEMDGRGVSFSSSTEFILPTGAALSPDAGWISNVRLSSFSMEEQRRFLPVAPEFVAEVMSPSDRLPSAQEKMQAWIRGGVQLAWLIDGDRKTVYIYRAGGELETRSSISSLIADGPIAGFELDLTKLWSRR
jgi:Uma2 family endonuclease